MTTPLGASRNHFHIMTTLNYSSHAGKEQIVIISVSYMSHTLFIQGVILTYIQGFHWPLLVAEGPSRDPVLRTKVGLVGR